jgi:hypothetical protein
MIRYLILVLALLLVAIRPAPAQQGNLPKPVQSLPAYPCVRLATKPVPTGSPTFAKDGNAARRCLHRGGCWRRNRDNDIGMEIDEFLGQDGQLCSKTLTNRPWMQLCRAVGAIASLPHCSPLGPQTNHFALICPQTKWTTMPFSLSVSCASSQSESTAFITGFPDFRAHAAYFLSSRSKFVNRGS